MPSPLSIFLIAGARPNFMKVAPLMRALRRREAPPGGVRPSLVHTGQHYDPNMSEVFFRELGIPAPDHHLGVGSGSHAEQTARVMVEFEKLAAAERPDLVVVVGDVNSTIACSLAAKKLGIRIAHVEAGLRSFDMTMPEEVNRRLTDAISDLLFVTEEAGRRNLLNEGVPADRIFFVGNVMIDTLFHELEGMATRGFEPAPEVGRALGGSPRYGLLTLHRPSNVDDPASLRSLWGALVRVSGEVPLLFPVHPRTRGKLAQAGLSSPGITLLDPLGYRDMVWLMRGAAVVLTDSGGIQEETTALGVPCVTLRENTERPVTLEMGTNVLAGTDPDAVVAAALAALAGKGRKGSIPPLWDGRAAERIAEVLAGEGPRPQGAMGR